MRVVLHCTMARVDFVSQALAQPQSTVVYAVRDLQSSSWVGVLTCQHSQDYVGDWQIWNPELCSGWGSEAPDSQAWGRLFHGHLGSLSSPRLACEAFPPLKSSVERVALFTRGGGGWGMGKLTEVSLSPEAV